MKVWVPTGWGLDVGPEPGGSESLGGRAVARTQQGSLQWQEPLGCPSPLNGALLRALLRRRGHLETRRGTAFSRARRGMSRGVRCTPRRGCV